MHDLISGPWDYVFFGKRFHTVREGLKKTERTHPVWTVTVLYAAQPFAFKNCRQGKKPRKGKDESRDRNERRSKGLPPGGCELRQQVLQGHKNLVQVLGHRVPANEGSPLFVPGFTELQDCAQSSVGQVIV